MGHFAPVIVDQHGQQQVINLDQTKQTEGSCLTQSVLFLEAYEKELAKNGGNVDEAVKEARSVAENEENVKKRNKMLGKAMRSNSELKNSYYQGTTVKSDRIVGGLRVEGERIIVEPKDLAEFNRLVENGKRDNVFDDFFKITKFFNKIGLCLLETIQTKKVRMASFLSDFYIIKFDHF